MVLAETLRRVTNSSNDAGRKIVFSSNEIMHFTGGWIKEKSIDCEVPSFGVMFRRRKDNSIWMASVRIRTVCSECGYVNSVSASRAQNGDHPKGCTNSNGISVPKELPNLFWTGG